MAAAVEIRNCSKTYETISWRPQKSRAKSKPVLDNLNMTIPQGSIYALLGPSGCGKTTLIKCILGRLRLYNGTIKIFGRDIGVGIDESDVGYMPQDTAVFTLLTIEETLAYFGKILGLSKALIKCQIDFLVEFLKLPSKTTLNKNLSGGEVRRLSFAVASIHKPKLLILDEPTVGVDPIGRMRMWSYLRHLVENFSTTVILSTHYIEEARTVNNVGLMQDGSMLVEGAPDFLLRTWNVPTLEELFFKVYLNHLENGANCDFRVTQTTLTTSHNTDIERTSNQKNVESESYLLNEIINQKLNNLQTRKSSAFKKGTSLMISRLAATVEKNCISLYRNPITIFFLIVLPACNLTLCLLCLSGNFSGLNVGFLNEDLGTFGNLYLESLNNDVVTQIEYHSYASGQQAVVDGRILALIFIPNNFSDTVTKRFLDIDMLKKDKLEDGFLNITIDTTDVYVTNVLLEQIISAMKNMNDKALLEAGLSPKFSNYFIQVHFQPEELLDLTRFSVLPIGLIMFITTIQLGASIMFYFMEKQSNHLERTLVAGLTFFDIIAGNIIIYLVINLVQIAVLLLVVHVIFQLPQLGSIALTVLISVVSGLAGMSIGMLFSVLFDQLLILGTILMVVLFIMPGVTGLILPLEASPYFFQIFCYVLPFHLPIEALKDVMYRNMGIFHYDVIIGIAHVLAWLFVMTLLSIICLRRKFR